MNSTATLPALFAYTVARGGDLPAVGTIHGGQIRWRTWRDLATDVHRTAAALVKAGVEPGDRVAQVSENCYEWIVADLALHLARAVHVPIHATLAAVQIAEQVTGSGARLAFVASDSLQSTLAGLVPAEVRLVSYESGLAKFLEGACCEEGAALQQAAVQQTQPADLATILYTSGTTGQPRGVMLSQGNVAGNAVLASDTVGGDPRETRLLFLPLSHIYARTCDLYSWLYLGSKLVLVESRETIVRDCELVGPSVINGVPYFYQKLHDRIRFAQPADEGAALRKVLGGRLRHAFCGGAAMAPDVEQWFSDCGLPVLCGYGLTETAPVISMSTQADHRLGSVGKPLAGVELRFSDEGELLVRGPNVMLGYWQDEAATGEAIRDGWLHTGDLARQDEAGFLFIRGRQSERIVLSTGKNVSPTRVEGLLAASPLVEQVAVVGEGRSHLGAIIVPAKEPLRAEIRRRGIFVWSKWQALRSRKVRAIYAEEIAGRLATAAREEQVHSFVLLGRGFSVERGELTPKLSLRRDVIDSSFHKQINRMYKPRRG